MKRSNMAVAILSLSALSASPSVAASRQVYDVDANSSMTIIMQICSPSAFVSARGDGDTDLDFEIVSLAGNVVHRDSDGTDFTWATLRGPSGGGACRPYRLNVSNLGDVYNRMTVAIR